MKQSGLSDRMRRLVSVLGTVLLIVGAVAFVAFILRDVLKVDIGFQGNLLPLILLMTAGGGLLVASRSRTG